jgi:malate dehydrogenase (oxaloacetate-decarboxylating)
LKELNGKSVILRVEIDLDQTHFGKLADFIAGLGGDIIAIDTIHNDNRKSVRDITINVSHGRGAPHIVEALTTMKGIRVVNVSDRTFLLHLGGKIEMNPKINIQNRDDLSRVYTPDVARVCEAIREDENKAYSLTIKRNTVAVVSDGTAVLGLGNIGPYAAMPVMEGKAMLFKQFAGVDAFPICLDTQNTDEIIATIKRIAPAFGGINLEDISSPRCFEIEERLREELDIPVFHDDQHGTAVVVYAGLINALKVVNKTIADIKVVICGIGAAGVACSKILLAAGIKDIVGVDKAGIVNRSNCGENVLHEWYVNHTNPRGISGTLQDALRGADIFIGVSAGGVLTKEMVETMAKDPIVFAMANPTPEIFPEFIEDAVGVIATDRSDYPNQINNVLCFPGIFRAALDCRATCINEDMKLAAAEAIASVITDEQRNKYYVVPSVFDKQVVEVIRDRVIQAAIRTGVARRIPKEYR